MVSRQRSSRGSILKRREAGRVGRDVDMSGLWFPGSEYRERPDQLGYILAGRLANGKEKVAPWTAEAGPTAVKAESLEGRMMKML